MSEVVLEAGHADLQRVIAQDALWSEAVLIRTKGGQLIAASPEGQVLQPSKQKTWYQEQSADDKCTKAWTSVPWAIY